MNLEITNLGKQNKIIKHIRALKEKKHRQIYKQYLIEGTKMLIEAVNADVPIEIVLCDLEYDLCQLQEITNHKDIGKITYRTSKEIFSSLSDVVTPQGILAAIGIKETDIQDCLNKDKFTIVLLDEIQDPGNLGTIIRTVDAANADAVILFEGCADPLSPKVIRSTMGSIFRIPVFEVSDVENLFKTLKKSNTEIIVGDLLGEDMFVWQGGYDKTALIIGNESRGVSSKIQKYANRSIRIPMPGSAESLNASVAAALLLYEVMRKSKK